MKIVILLSLMLLKTVWLTGQVGDQKSAFKERLKAQSNINKTIVCEFSQTKKVKSIKNSIVSNGDFYYDNSGMMAMIYKQPDGDKLILKNNSFYLHSGGKTLVSDASSNPMMAQISNMMKACMSGTVSDLGRGWKMDVTENGKSVEVILQPQDRRVRKYVVSMTMDFNGSDLTLDRLRIDETNGGYTEYRFFEKKLNVKFDNSVFNISK
jgi:outer membrane lipoprotein carrier protein